MLGSALPQPGGLLCIAMCLGLSREAARVWSVLTVWKRLDRNSYTHLGGESLGHCSHSLERFYFGDACDTT